MSILGQSRYFVFIKRSDIFYQIRNILDKRVIHLAMASRERVSRLKDISPDDMTREQLLIRVRQLEQHVTNLRNIINKKSEDGQQKEQHGKRKQPRPFDFKQYNTRHVALKIAYLGWDYNGYVVQEETSKTIEANLFDALQKTHLIECREVTNYHRCGRTDKGVSAFSQVISLDLRTRLHEGKGVKVSDSLMDNKTTAGLSTDELPYCSMLNRVLPPDIRVLAWCPVDTDFSARFDCKQRTYKYFFPRANLNIELMKTAARKLVGTHDFRNLCKMDVGNKVTQFIREVRHVSVNILGENANINEDPYTMCEIKVVGNAFLWHQIRCIVAILFMVGEGKEPPEIIDTLLDVTNNPRKPQYQMASELPLVLFDCQFEDVDWIIDEESHTKLLLGFQREWTKSAVKTAMIKSLLDELAKVNTKQQGQETYSNNPLLFAVNLESKSRTHKPLLQRQLCESLEDRIEYHMKRRKYEQEVLSQNNVATDNLDQPSDIAPDVSKSNVEKSNHSESREMNSSDKITDP